MHMAAARSLSAKMRTLTVVAHWPSEKMLTHTAMVPWHLEKMRALLEVVLLLLVRMLVRAPRTQ